MMQFFTLSALLLWTAHLEYSSRQSNLGGAINLPRLIAELHKSSTPWTKLSNPSNAHQGRKEAMSKPQDLISQFGIK